jgi:DNA-binding CsgD family transcriptional regulator
MVQQDLELAETPLAVALILASEGDDQRVLAMVHVLSAMLALFQRRFDDVATHAKAAETYADPFEDLGSVVRARFFAAMAARDGGELELAASLFEDLLVQTQEAGAMYFQALALQWSAALIQGQGNSELAATRYTDALGIFREGGELVSVAGCLDGIAGVGIGRDAVSSARLLGAAAELRSSIGAPMLPQDRPIHEQAVAAAKASLGEAAFAEAWDAGAQLSLDVAIEMATTLVAAGATVRDDAKSPVIVPAGLTPRELEVLRLVAEGCSDREIAETLFISHNTAMKHVANILMKLDVESRTAAAAFAHRQGIA